VKRLALISALALVSSTAGATMLLLGAGGGSGGGGGGGGPTTVYQCNDSYSLSNATASSPDGDGYRTITTSADFAMATQPASGGITVVDGTAYTTTVEIKNTGGASYLGVELQQDGTRRITAIFATSNGAYQAGTNVSSNSTTDLGGGKYRLTFAGTIADWTGNPSVRLFACTDGPCNDSPVNTTFVYNTSTCKVTTP
jgi:hypothetical protein